MRVNNIAMAYGELYLPPIINNVKSDGRFKKGVVPFNKGKKWEEYTTEDARKRMAKGWENLKKYRCTSNGGMNKKQIIGVREDGTWRCFASAHAASSILGIDRGNISKCANRNLKKRKSPIKGSINTNYSYKGYRFYFESDDIWLTKIT